MPTPFASGEVVYQRIKQHSGLPLFLKPREEIDLAAFVLEVVVICATDDEAGMMAVVVMLNGIKSKTTSHSTIIRLIDRYFVQPKSAEREAANRWSRLRDLAP